MGEGGGPAATSAAMHSRDRAAGLIGYDVVSVEPGRAVVRMVVRT